MSLALNLRPHQIRASEQFTKKCFCTGMLLYHRMGTGKTATVLAILMNHPGANVLLLHPPGIDSQWHREIQKYFQRAPGDALPFNIEYLTYQQFFQGLSLTDVEAAVAKSSIIVADEAQNIAMLKLNAMTDPQRARVLEARRLLTTRRTILVSGTPIDNNIADLATLINIAAQKRVLPVNQQLFMDQFGTTRIANARLSYAAPIMYGLALMLVVAVLVGLPRFFNGFEARTETAGKLAEEIGEEWCSDRTRYLKKIDMMTSDPDVDAEQIEDYKLSGSRIMNTYAMERLLRSAPGREWIQQLTGKIQTILPQSIISDVAHSIHETSNVLIGRPLGALLSHLLDLKTNPIAIVISEPQWFISKWDRGTGIYAAMSVWDLLFFPILFYAISAAMNQFYLNFSKGKERYVDANKLYQVVKDYMTFFDYQFDSTGEAQRSFPRLTLIQYAHPYDKVQTEAFVRFVTGRSTPADLAALQLSNGVEDWEAESNKANMDKFLNNGRNIANFTKDDFTYFEWRDRVQITTDETSRALSARDTTDTFQYYYCLKFATLETMIRQDVSDGKRVVVYSCFRTTFDKLSVYLSHCGIRHLKLNVSDSTAISVRIQNTFADLTQPYSVLLLDPSLTEGINLGVASTLHVLEPISNWGQQEQVYARVLRQLPQPVASESERPNATIYQWVETLPSIATVMKRTVDYVYNKQILKKVGISLEDVGAWAFGSRASMFIQNDSHNFDAFSSTMYPNHSTPGQLTLENLHEIAHVMTRLQAQLARTSTVNNACALGTHRDCEIWKSFDDPGTCQTAPPGNCSSSSTILSGGYCTRSNILNTFLGMVHSTYGAN